MATFFYRCKFENEIKEGTIEASDMPNASKKLEAKGMVVLELKREEAISQQVSLNYEIAPLTIKEKKDFYNAFYKQYKAGISFFEIFNNIISTASTNNIKTLCFNMGKKFQKGQTSEEVFNYYSRYIGKTQAALLIAGDESGKLENVLKKITEQINEEEKTITTLISKTKYPLMIFCLIIFALCVFVFLVFPVFNSVIDGKSVEFASALAPAIIKIAIVMVILGMVIFNVVKNKDTRKKLFNSFVKLKKVKDVLEKYYYSNFFTTFYLAQEAGLPIDESLELSRQTVDSELIKTKISKAILMIKEGSNVATALGVLGIFSEYALSQISIGEKSGELTKSLDEVSNDYQKEFSSSVDSFLKFIEPAMIGIAGVVVLVMGAKMYSKYYEMLNSLF